MSKAVAEEKAELKDGEDWPADSKGIADDDASDAKSSSSRPEPSLCAPVSKYFYEDDEFAAVFERWVEERAHRIDPALAAHSTECVWARAGARRPSTAGVTHTRACRAACSASPAGTRTAARGSCASSARSTA